MSDEPTPTIPAAIVCPVEDCHALVPDTIEDRRAHRVGHKHREKVDEAIRKLLRELRTDFDTLRGTVRDDVRAIRDEVAGIDRAVGQIEIPEPVAPLTISRGGWDDDDEDEDADAADAAAVEDEWGIATRSEPDLDPNPDADEDEVIAVSAHDYPTGVPTPADVRPAWAR